MILSAQWQLGNAGRNCRTNNFLDFSCSHWPLDSWPSKPASLLARDQILPVTGDVDRFIRGGRKTALPCNVLYVHTTTISVSVPNRRAAVLTFIRIFSEVIKSLNLGDPSNRPLFPPNITSEGREAVEAPSEHLIIFSLGKESMARRTKKNSYYLCIWKFYIKRNSDRKEFVIIHAYYVVLLLH